MLAAFDDGAWVMNDDDAGAAFCGACGGIGSDGCFFCFCCCGCPSTEVVVVEESDDCF